MNIVLKLMKNHNESWIPPDMPYNMFLVLGWGIYIYHMTWDLLDLVKTMRGLGRNMQF